MGRLEARGREVFFDGRKIHPGNDWREIIARETSSSDSMVACLSKYAMRENSVCHDELDIAVGLLDGNVLTVLLDAEDEVRALELLRHC